MKRSSRIFNSVSSFAKNFLASLSIGFFIGLGVVFYFMGARGVRQQVCRGYAENAKSLAESRAEKESYLESFVPRSGDVLVEIAKVEGDDEVEDVEASALLNSVAQDSSTVVKSLPAVNGVKPAVKHVAKKVSRYRKNTEKISSKNTAKVKASSKKLKARPAKKLLSSVSNK